jgi:hypothetical protein
MHVALPTTLLPPPSSLSRFLRVAKRAAPSLFFQQPTGRGDGAFRVLSVCV